MKRRALIEKGLALGAMACVPAAWGLALPRPAPATEGPFWLVPAAPWPYFQIYTEYPLRFHVRDGKPWLPCCHPDLWRTERISYYGDCTKVTLRPYSDPAGSRLQLRLARIPDLSWGHGYQEARIQEDWSYLWVGPGRPWAPPGPSPRTRHLLMARFDALMRGQGDTPTSTPHAWRSGYGRTEV